MEWWIYVAVVAAGLLAGFINTLAGSGSLITLPMLMFAGLDPVMANGTNRVAIFLQNVVAVGSFRKQKVFEYSEAKWMAIPALVGSLIGALIASRIDKDVMEKVIAGLMFVMFFVVLLKPEAWIKQQAGSIAPKPSVWQVIIYFGVGLYGGFIQVGIGLFILASLVLGSGLELVKANAIKVFIVLLYTPIALIVFALNSQVDYKIGLVLAVGNMLGAFVATKMAVKWGAVFVRYILLAVVLFSAIKFMFF